MVLTFVESKQTFIIMAHALLCKQTLHMVKARTQLNLMSVGNIVVYIAASITQR
jgi:hypothetical protein